MPKERTGIDLPAILRKVPYFAALDDEPLRKLAAAARVLACRKREMIVWEGESCDGLYVVLCGRVKVFKRSEQGREQVLLIVGPGRTFNDVPVFDAGTNPGSVAAVEASTVALLPKASVLKVVEQNPAVAMAVIRVLAARMRGLTGVVEGLALRSVTARVAKILMDWAGGRAALLEAPTEGGIRLTQSQLAAMTGSVREVVQRALKTLEQDGAIKLSRARITMLDAAALKKWAKGADGTVRG
jgi:CRP/FNR family transcriptional regulator